MQAVVFRGVGVPLEIADVDVAQPKAGEVRVRIAAAGVCHSDLHVLQGDWQPPVPLVMGHEGAGVVTAVGKDVTRVFVGDHVILSWVPACGRCRYCLAGRPARCELVAKVVAPNGVLYDGTTRFKLRGEDIHHYLGVSSFAEEVVVPESGAIPVRQDAPLETIAIVGCAVATGVGAVLRTAEVRAGASIVVIGCGGVGLSVVQGARLAGARQIVAVDLLPAKLKIAADLGATDIVDGSVVDAVARVRQLTDGGADYVFDAIGKVTTTEQAIAMLGLGGAAVIVGLPPTGAKATFEPLALAEADQRIIGSNYGSIDPARDVPWLVDLYMDGKLKLDELISGRRPLAEVGAAFADLAAGQALRTLLIP